MYVAEFNNQLILDDKIRYFCLYETNIAINPLFDLTNKEIIEFLDRLIKFDDDEKKHIYTLLLSFEIFEYLYYSDEFVVKKIIDESNRKDYAFKNNLSNSFFDAITNKDYLFCRKLISFKELHLFCKKENIEELKYYLNHLPNLDRDINYKFVKEKFNIIKKDLVAKYFLRLEKYFEILSFFFSLWINELKISNKKVLFYEIKTCKTDSLIKNTISSDFENFNSASKTFIEIDHKKIENINYKLQKFDKLLEDL